MIRTRNEGGYVLLSAMVTLLLFATTVLMIVSMSMTGLRVSVKSGDLSTARANVSAAFDSALARLNSGTPGTLPTAATPATVERPEGTASWWLEGGHVHVTADAGDVELAESKPVRLRRVGDVSEEGDTPVYALAAHGGAWDSALTTMWHSTVTGEVTGEWTVLGGIADRRDGTQPLTVSTHPDAKVSDGADASVSPAPISATLDTDLLDARLAWCSSFTPLTSAATLGSGPYCASTVAVPTTVNANGFPTVIFAAGDVRLCGDVNTMGTAQLHVYSSGGSVEFCGEGIEADVHVYAPYAHCSTTPGASATVNGSLACRTVEITGTVNHVPPRAQAYPWAPSDRVVWHYQEEAR